jgi:DNA mismatch endonuclease (patch repair protein)
MPDVFSKSKRSAVMAAIRSKGNKDTELVLVKLLRADGIRGWRRHVVLPGTPDFVFRRQRVAIFIDGCFWHGCSLHSRPPKSNQDYWSAKLARNRRRDRAVSRLLRKAGWRVLRIWEHDLTRKRAAATIRRIQGALLKQGYEKTISTVGTV